MRSKSSSRAALPPALALVAACCVSASFAFAPAPTRRHVARLNRCAAANGDVVGGDGRDGGDDDDDFDPLRSPHEYPGGIDAGAQRRQSQSPLSQSQSESERDDFDPFLTSPHDFPSAIMAPPSSGAGTAEDADGDDDDDDDDDDDWSPLRNAMKVEKFDEHAPAGGGSGGGKVRLTSGWAVPSAGTAAASRSDPPANGGDDFDPLLSPHEYSRGIDAGTQPTAAGTASASATATTPSTGTASAKVGVLLIDHGSRRSTSNDRLLELAAAYQRAAPPNYVVAAAHMEIAPPTIEDGIRTLLAADDGGLTRIVCHPYFLSPGRHVTEDIPQLVAEAVAAVGRPDVEVATTEPVGSGLDVMVAAIGGLVDATVREMEMGGGGDRQEGGDPEAGRGGDEYRLGGFFGEVQRMVDEQLD